MFIVAFIQSTNNHLHHLYLSALPSFFHSTTTTIMSMFRKSSTKPKASVTGTTTAAAGTGTTTLVKRSKYVWYYMPRKIDDVDKMINVSKRTAIDLSDKYVDCD
jgi:hypothetical protein